jgi:RNA exonuclease 1
MKRAEMSSPAPPSASQAKKLKLSDDTLGEEDGWTKVERRKDKKAKKKEAKLDVCVSSFFLLTPFIGANEPFKSTPPRFMYSHGEIVKRSHAVGIAVRLLKHARCPLTPHRTS